MQTLRFRNIVFIPFVITLLMTTGCFKNNETNTSAKPSAKPSETQIKEEKPKTGKINLKTRVFYDEIKEELGEVLAFIQIQTPELVSTVENEGISKMNALFQNEEKAYLESIANDASVLAEADKRMAQEQERIFMPHGYGVSYDVFYLSDEYISIVQTYYQNNGGARPSLAQKARTFNLNTGEVLTLENLLKLDKNAAKERLMESVEAELKNDENDFRFSLDDSYEQNIRSMWMEDDFYLAEDSIVVFYQEGVLGSQALGFLQTKIPFHELPLKINFSKQANRSDENQLNRQVAMLIQSNVMTFKDIFGLKMLDIDFDETKKKEESFYPVVDENFTTYAQLETFLGNVYIEETKNELLQRGRYKDIDGKLYANIMKDSSMGYAVNWNRYSFEVKESDSKRSDSERSDSERSDSERSDSERSDSDKRDVVIETAHSEKEDEKQTFRVGLHKKGDIWLLEEMFF